jgi:hypothetical protein
VITSTTTAAASISAWTVESQRSSAAQITSGMYGASSAEKKSGRAKARLTKHKVSAGAVRMPCQAQTGGEGANGA